MPSHRGWNERLADSSIEFFTQAIGDHDKVIRVNQESDNVFVVERVGGLPEVRVWLCDVYTLGLADYFHITKADPDVDAIVTISGFNSWTREAKEQGYEDEVGVFKFGQFMGALHEDGDSFVHYQPPKGN
jgi:hypothetical protein